MPVERWQVMRPMTLVFSAFAALAIAGCATMNVSSHVERGDNLPVGDLRPDNNRGTARKAGR